MQEMLVWVTGEAHFVMLVLFLVSGMLLSPRVRSGETVVPSDVGRFPMRTQRWVPARPLRYLPKSGRPLVSAHPPPDIAKTVVGNVLQHHRSFAPRAASELCVSLCDAGLRVYHAVLPFQVPVV
jgi:hypothetical protein